MKSVEPGEEIQIAPDENAGSIQPLRAGGLLTDCKGLTSKD